MICAPPLLQINQDTYAREEHKWDDSDLEGGPRAARFPSTLYVPEGVPCREPLIQITKTKKGLVIVLHLSENCEQICY